MAQARFGKEQRDGSIVGREFVRVTEIFERQIDFAQRLAELAGAQITVRGKILLAEFFRQFRHDQMAVGIVGIELRDFFVAAESLGLLIHFVVALGGGVVLLDGFGYAILLLELHGVADQALGWLRDAAQETAIDRGGFGGIAGIEQAIELQAVVMGGADWLIQADVEIAQSQDGFLIRGASSKMA